MPEHYDVYRDPERFAGWPANYGGLWTWGDEIVAMFSLGWRAEWGDFHARDKSRPFVDRVARSLDGGCTWQIEPFAGVLPGSGALAGDEHLGPSLPLKSEAEVLGALRSLDEPIDFTDPETIVLCGRTGLVAGALCWFYVSKDRARTWAGPFRLGDFGVSGISARTDIVALGPHEALFMLTAMKPNGKEGHVFAARSRDGGRSFVREGFLGPEPVGRQIMPASLKLADDRIISLSINTSPRMGGRTGSSTALPCPRPDRTATRRA